MSGRGYYGRHVIPTAVGATSESGSSLVGAIKTIAIFSLVAIPAGLYLARRKDRSQERAERAEFRRLGWDWDQRARY